MAHQEVILSVSDVSKGFPGVRALNGVSFELRKGEVHALLGENGAGKSTLMKILTGVIRKDSGSVRYDGRELDNWTIEKSQQAGIAMIYQELHLVPNLSVAENIYLGREPKRGLLVDYKKMREDAAAILAQLGVSLDPQAKIASLSVAYQQIVEISKAVSLNARVLIMDEPTAPLTNEEVSLLFDLVRRLKASGVSIIYISHRLEELAQICDRATVFRDGAYVDTLDVAGTDKATFISLMVGREMTNLFPPRSVVDPNSPEILRTENLSTRKVRHISLELKRGEILGIAGLVGAGRTEFLRALCGADPITGGKIFMHGREVRIASPRDAIAHRIAMVPEDRKKQGLVLGMSVRDNLTYPNLDRFSRFGFLSPRSILARVSETIQQLRIKTPSDTQRTIFLSGGNQQKVVIGKWLLADPEIILFDEPTRGIDVGAKYEIYCIMNELKSQGKSVIMVSSEMPELIGMADRMYVFCDGRLTGQLSQQEMDEEMIMRLAADFSSNGSSEFREANPRENAI